MRRQQSGDHYSTKKKLSMKKKLKIGKKIRVSIRNPYKEKPKKKVLLTVRKKKEKTPFGSVSSKNMKTKTNKNGLSKQNSFAIKSSNLKSSSRNRLKRQNTKRMNRQKTVVKISLDSGTGERVFSDIHRKLCKTVKKIKKSRRENRETTDFETEALQKLFPFFDLTLVSLIKVENPKGYLELLLKLLEFKTNYEVVGDMEFGTVVGKKKYQKISKRHKNFLQSAMLHSKEFGSSGKERQAFVDEICHEVYTNPPLFRKSSVNLNGKKVFDRIYSNVEKIKKKSKSVREILRGNRISSVDQSVPKKKRKRRKKVKKVIKRENKKEEKFKNSAFYKISLKYLKISLQSLVSEKCVVSSFDSNGLKFFETIIHLCSVFPEVWGRITKGTKFKGEYKIKTELDYFEKKTEIFAYFRMAWKNFLLGNEKGGNEVLKIAHRGYNEIKKWRISRILE